MTPPEHIATIARDTTEHVALARAATPERVRSWYRTLFPDGPPMIDSEAARRLVVMKLESDALVRIREEL